MAARVISPAPRTASPSLHRTTSETLAIDLRRLLSRLESQVLDPTADTTSLAHSAYERARVRANVEYARTLLLRLDHASAGIKTGTRKTAAQNDLAAQKETIKRLGQRLLELDQLDEADSSSDDDDDEDEQKDEQGAGRVREFAPAIKTNAGLDYNPLTTAGIKGIPAAEVDKADAQQGLRARGGADMKGANRAQPDTASTTALFGDRSKRDTPTSTTQVLEESEREHSLLTTSLVTLAQTLKSSSLAFQESLASEKEVLKHAEQGLEKNETGMESAGRRMGTLRRMTEGQGWWGRIKLYAIIAALWLACFLLVFVGPKLRF